MVHNIRSGMNDARLIETYHLSSKGLQRVFTKLVEAKAITPEELFDRVPVLAAEDSVGAASVRLLARDFLEVRVPVRDVMNPRDLGQLRNISEKGIGVRGIQARTGETKTLMVLADELFPVEPCKLEAVCRWVKRSRTEGIIDAGFEITDISEEGMQQLEKIVRWLSFRG